MIPFYLQPRFWLDVGILAAVVGLSLYMAHLRGRISDAESKTSACELQVAQHLLADAQAAKDDESDARAKERADVTEKAAIAQSLQEKVDALQTDLDHALALRGTAERKLRDKFTCASLRPSVVPGAGSGAGGSHGADDAGLSAEDEGFLVREATRANLCVTRLTACQETVVSDRKTCNGKRQR